MPTQDHIHLSTSQADVTNEAPITIWKITDRIETPQVFISVKRTITSRLKVYTAHDNGEPIQLTDYRYSIKVVAENGYTLEDRMAQLKNMNGRIVYLVDIIHPNDGVDHSAHVRRMLLQVGEFPPFSVALDRFYVDIELTDHTLE